MCIYHVIDLRSFGLRLKVSNLLRTHYSTSFLVIDFATSTSPMLAGSR